MMKVESSISSRHRADVLVIEDLLLYNRMGEYGLFLYENLKVFLKI